MIKVFIERMLKVLFKREALGSVADATKVYLTVYDSTQESVGPQHCAKFIPLSDLPNAGRTASASYGTITGTVSRAAFTIYVSPDIASTYNEVQLQALADAVAANSAHLAAVITDLKAGKYIA